MTPRPLPHRFDPLRWDPRGRTAPTAARVLFWGTIALIVLVRGFNSHQLDGFVPPPFDETPVLYMALLAFLAPTVVLWPLLPWSPSPSRRQTLATVGFVVSTLAVYSVADFGHHLLMAVAVAQTTCAYGPRVGVLPAFLFGGVNFSVQYMVPPFTDGQALFNSALITVTGLIICFVVAGLAAAAHRAQHTRDLLTDLEETHRKLRHYTARTRELAVAEERSRMAREMHDSTGHHLTAINVCLANAERGGPVPDQVREDIGEARRLAKQALEETRRWVRALKPLNLEGRNGAEAIGALVQSFADTGASTRFRLEGVWPDTMDGEAELAAYRAAQEGLTNALRHSGADHIDVTVYVDERHVAVEIADNGVGAGDGATDHGFGLTTLEERLSALGGSLTGHNRPEGGYVLTARVPREFDPSLESVR
ncbi:sensor histidine kinase [Nocardiopsis sp. HNM0947]|uniref:histidine kinase n=1 Tax=Nocardiopsis coralli TaxID=2772213 RepID=A0ABR9P7Y3_9ACTN|nr:sensor histidine kinase [Nocardiopsis coralli]MBE2999946.1 sensor histidine kinase [Nocardiopsis coralli]